MLIKHFHLELVSFLQQYQQKPLSPTQPPPSFPAKPIPCKCFKLGLKF